MADFVVPHKPVVSDAKSRLLAPIHTERHVNVICIGAGASGLVQAYKIQKEFQNMSITVFEKNADVAGTWYENRYPGYVTWKRSCFPGGILRASQNIDLTVGQLRM